MSARTKRLRPSDFAPAAILLAALCLKAAEPAALESLQNKVFDAFQAQRPRAYASSPARVIDIDDESLRRLGPWPWPRSRTALLVSKLARLGAKTIVLDVVFAEPEPTDASLLKAMAGASVVTGFMLTSHPNETRPALKTGVSYVGPSPLPYLPDFPGAVADLPAFEAAAAGNGAISLVPEPDGVIRRLPLLLRRGETLYPSLMVEVLRVHQDAGGIVVKTELGGISEVRTGGVTLPTDASGRLWVHYAASDPSRAIPAWRLLAPDFRSNELTGAVAFVGSSAQRLQDLRATPLGPSMPGVEIHAQAVEQALAGRMLSRPLWAKGVELAYLLLLGLALIALTPRLSAARSAALGLAAAGAGWPLAWRAYVDARLLFDPLFPALALLAVYSASALASYLKAEDERRRLLLLDEAKDEMLSVASHDLRGPVNAMIMIVDAMSQGQFGALNEKQARYLKLINNQGRKLNDFVANILDTAKIKAGKLELHRQAVSPGEAIDTVAEVFAVAAEAKSVTLKSLRGPALPPVYADQAKLEQVLNNLLGNALKFTPSGGRIEVSAVAEGEHVRFCVADTGMGIAAGEIETLFRRFSQADKDEQADRGIQGTGLGLAICRELAEAHGGRIWVESVKGKGSSFYFTIPIAPGEPPPPGAG